jgi:tetratricopeptide (TPR) repeat protein
MLSFTMPDWVESAVGAVVLLVVFIGVLWRVLSKSDEPGVIVKRLIYSLPSLALLTWAIVNLEKIHPLVTVPVMAIGFLFLGIIWTPNIGAIIAKPLTSLYEGEDEPPEQKPFYSIATAFRLKSRPRDAIAEIHKQLERFPDDFQGQLLLATIHAEDLHDLDAASFAIEKILSQNHIAANKASALMLLADWHFHKGKNADEAIATLRRVQELFPESNFAQIASQRIAHIRPEMIKADSSEPSVVPMKKFEGNIGIRKVQLSDVARVKTPEEEAELLLQQLAMHPADVECREKLALLYLDELNAPDMALFQLQELVKIPNQSPRQMAKWYHLLADLHIKGANAAEAERVLKELQQMFPGTAFSDRAAMRLDYLSLELKGHKKSQAIPLGSYGKDLGLKVNGPRPEP